jgi:acetyltransferase-like isoleucine patch superfamily enzyme
MSPCSSDELLAAGMVMRLAGDRCVGFRPKSSPATFVEAPFQDKGAVYDVGSIGGFSYIGGGTATVIKRTSRIGRFCAIAGNVNIGPVEHPPHFLSTHMLFEGGMASHWPVVSGYYERNEAHVRNAALTLRRQQEQHLGLCEIGNDVWIGEGAFLRRGVKVGDGAIIGARSVVTRDVPPYAVVAGSPAKVLRLRFDPAIVAELLSLKWWDYGLSALEGVDVTDIDQAVATLRENIASGRAEPYRPAIYRIEKNGRISLAASVE